MTIQPGSPTPPGVSQQNGLLNFSVLVRDAAQVHLRLYERDGGLQEKIPLQPAGDFWHVAVAPPAEQLFYCYEVVRDEREPLHLGDPYARNLNVLHEWRRHRTWPAPVASLHSPDFEWGNDTRPQVAIRDMVIYEAHVKGLTIQFPDLPADIRGTYGALGHAAIIAHLKRLGVTTLELLPVCAKTKDPFLVDKGLHNYWGYNTLNYFAPESEYAAKDAILEFKSMVRDLHAAGIEVILDMVYNHTGEGGPGEPPVSYRGLAEEVWYLTDEEGKYIDYTHCGNTLNTEHGVVCQMIIDSLRYWAEEMRVDGFRFDLAPAIFRKRDIVTFDHELHHAIINDALLRSVKLIVEPWDLGPNGYQRGKFPQPYLEWNDVFRDTTRGFWKGERSGEELSKVMVHDGPPVINFITCHDGFTLRDLVSYEQKRNHANGEDNRDGSNHNHSFNCGAEGETDNQQVLELRKRQRKNLLMTLFFAQDVPMLLAGDEIGNSQQGNNNAYCQDNEISWLDWHLREDDLCDFVRSCVELRKQVLAKAQRHVIFTPNTHHQAVGVDFGDFVLLMNASGENVFFKLPGIKLRELLHSGRACHDETMQEICFLSAQSSVLLQRVTG